MPQATLYIRPNVGCSSTRSPSSGGSWGLGAPGPAILWGPLQGRDPTFPSWSVGAGAQDAVRPTAVSGAEHPRQSILAGIY